MPVVVSQSWSMVTDTSSANVTLGMPMTRLASGNFVQATDANLIVSKSGMVDGIAVTVASPGQQFVAQTAGLIDAANVPMLGTSLTVDFLINVNGVLARSATFTAGCLGVAAKDGSAAITLGAGTIGGGGGGGSGTPGVVTATCTTTGAVGDVVTVDATDPTKVRLATDTALLVGIDGYGILLTPALVPNFPVLYAATDGVAPNSATGLGIGAATWVVVIANRPVRKPNPEPSDYVIGTSHTNGAVHVRKGRRFSGDIVIGSAGYECDKTGTLDCSAVIQKAIDDSYDAALPGYNRRPVRIPRGRYRMLKPAHLKQGGTQILGEGMDAVLLDGSQMSAPVLHCSNLLTSMIVPVSPPAFTGQTTAIHTQAYPDLHEPFIELREFGMGVDVDGLSELTIEMMVWVDPTQADQGVLLGSCGKRFPSEALAGGFNTAFYFSMDGNNNGCSNHCTVATTGVVNANYAPSGAWTGFPRGQWVWVEVNYGRGFMRMFVNGWKLPFIAIVGNIVQKTFESVQLGIGLSTSFGISRIANSANCNIGLLRVSKTIRNQFDGSANYTNVYTPPTSPPGLDGNTMWWSDFQTSYGVFVGARAIGARANPVTPENSWFQCWLPTTNNTASQGLNHLTIRDVGIDSRAGVAIEIQTSNNTLIQNIYVLACKTAVFMRNTCFNVYLKNIYATGGGDGSRIGLNFGDASYNSSFASVQMDGFDYGVVTLAAISGSDSYLIKNRQVGFFAMDASTVVLSNVSISDEGGGIGAAPFTCTGFVRCGTISLEASDLLCIFGTSVCVKAEDGYQFSQRFDLAMPGTSYGWHGAFTGPVVPGNYCFDIRVIDGTSHMGVFGETFQAALGDIGVFPGPELPIIAPTTTTGVEWNLMPRVVFKHIAIPMADANQTVTSDQALSGNFDCTGAMTAARNLSFPVNPSPVRYVFNNTTGGFNVVVKATGGAITTNVAPGVTMGFRCDGTEMRHIT